MNGLARLQRSFPLKENVTESITDNSTNEYQRYLEGYKTPKHAPLPLLEHARVTAFTGWEDEELGQTIELTNELDKLYAKFTQYHFELENYCDRLKPLEKGIDGFHDQLSHLAANFALLQQESTKLQVELEKLVNITNKLNPILLDLTIPPEVVKLVANGPINSLWVENIHFVNEKSNLIANVKQNKLPDKHLQEMYLNSTLFHQLEERVEFLAFKIVERVRDFMILKIKQLRSTKALFSSQKIQSDLLEVKEAFAFLQERHRDLANNLQLAYIYTMRWYYHTRFAKYIHSLEKLRLYNIDSSNLLGTPAEDRYSILSGPSGGGFSSWFGTSSRTIGLSTSLQLQQLQLQLQLQWNQVSPTEYLNSIHKRVEIIRQNESSSQLAMPSQIAETNSTPYWMEFVFNQWSVALESNIIVEYLFMVEFFYQEEEKFSPLEDLYPEGTTSTTSIKRDWSSLMFDKVFNIGLEFVGYLLTQVQANISQHGRTTVSGRVVNQLLVLNAPGTTCDAYALLLMIRLVQKSQLALHNKFHIPTMDDYHHQVLMLLWPHFTKIIDLHCDSMKKSILQSTDNKSLAPIALTQQFAQFLLGILTLCNSAGDQDYKGEPIVVSIGRLRNDFEGVLTKVSNNSFRSSKQVEREIFLYNNYFLVVNILRNEFGSSSLSTCNISDIVEEQINHFEKVCLAYKRT